MASLGGVPLPVVLAIGYGEILVVVLVIVLLFGAAKLPQLARALGKAKSDFESGKREGERESAEETRLRREAQDLGIETEGKSASELRRAITDAKKGRGA